MGIGVLSREKKKARREFNHPLPSGVEVMSVCVELYLYSSYAFMAWRGTNLSFFSLTFLFANKI